MLTYCQPYTESHLRTNKYCHSLTSGRTNTVTISPEDEKILSQSHLRTNKYCQSLTSGRTNTVTVSPQDEQILSQSRLRTNKYCHRVVIHFVFFFRYLLTYSLIYFKTQDCFIISSEKLKSWLNIYHVTADNMTHWLKEQLL